MATDSHPGRAAENHESSGPAPFGRFQNLRRSKLFLGVACALAALVCGLALQELPMFRSLERHTWDIRASLLAKPGPATDAVTLIKLDQNSLDWGQKENGLSWPWPREMYAVILDFCTRAGAASVTFDVLFSEPSFYGVDDDLILGEAVRRNGRCAMAAFPGEHTGNAEGWTEPYAPTLPDLSSLAATAPSYKRANFPVPEAGGPAAGVGSVNQPPDSDGINRHIHPLVFFAGKPMPSLPLAAYLLARPGTRITPGSGGLTLASGKAGQDVFIPLDDKGRALLNYRGRAGIYAGYNAAEVIRSELLLREGGDPTVAPDVLHGKHVLFGFTAPGLMDVRPVPPGGSFSGLEIQATALDNLLSGDFKRRVPVWATVALAAFLAFGASLCVTSVAREALLALAVIFFLTLPAVFAGAAYAANWWLPLVPLMLSAMLAVGLSFSAGYVTEGRQRRFLKNAFRRYLSETVIEEIIKEPDKLKLGGERRCLSIFFSDLAGFTSLSEKLGDPERITKLLNVYLDMQTRIILEEGGTLDKFLGDGIMAFWNAPQTQPDHAVRAVRAALRCARSLEDMRERSDELSGTPLLLRIGINTGEAVAGNIGSSERLDYTVIGDAVNLASRLEGVNKILSTSVIISETTAAAMGGAFAVKELGRITVVGRNRPVRIFEPLRHETYRENHRAITVFAEALAAFTDGRIPEAEKKFNAIAATDLTARAYARFCESAPYPVPADWDGVVRMRDK